MRSAYLRTRKWIAPIAFAMGCGTPKLPAFPHSAFAGSETLLVPGHPAIATATWQRDPADDTLGGLAIVLATDGASHPESTAIALAAILENQFADHPEVRIAADASSVRMDALFKQSAEIQLILGQFRTVLSSPIDESSWQRAKHSLDAITISDNPAQVCLGLPLRDGALTLADLENERRKIFGASSVAVGIDARKDLVDARSLVLDSPWPKGARGSCGKTASSFSVSSLSSADSGTTLRADVSVWRSPIAAIDNARYLAAPRSALVAKTHAIDGGSRISNIAAVVHANGGCVDVELETRSNSPSILGNLVAITRDEIEREIGQKRTTYELPTDPRDAATALAMEEMARSCAAPIGGDSVVIGVKPDADLTPKTHAPTDATLTAPYAAAIAAATKRWATQAPITRLVEPGQPEAMVLLASSCGSRAEEASTAGATLAVLSAIADRVRDVYGLGAAPFLSFDAAGILVHGHALADEDDIAFGRRLAEAASRAFEVDEMNSFTAPVIVVPDDALLLLASTLAPDHPTWIEPRVSTFSKLSKSVLDARLSGVRRGPLRAVVLANHNIEQAEAMATGIDRFLLREENRSCGVDTPIQMPKPGTYAVTKKSESVAYLALPIPSDAACESAPWLAATLRGTSEKQDGLLIHNLLGVVRFVDVRILDYPKGRFLVVHINAPGTALDSAVAQVRSLFNRLRQGALTGGDLAIASRSLESDRLALSVSPTLRLIEAWKNKSQPTAPTLENVRACAALTLRDEELIITTVRGSDP